MLAADPPNGATTAADASKLCNGTDQRSDFSADRRDWTRGARRPLRFEVRLSVAEMAALRDRAAAQGWAVGRLLVVSALQGPPTSAASEERARVAALLESRRLLANATGNLNQLAHVANIAGQVPALRALEAALVDVRDAADQVRRELRR